MTPDDAIHDRQADDATAAVRALDKLRAFVTSLDDNERAVLAALLAPGVASAYGEEPPEVVAFGMPEDNGAGGWQPERLPESLADQVRDQHVRIEFGNDA